MFRFYIIFIMKDFGLKTILIVLNIFSAYIFLNSIELLLKTDDG